MKFSAALLGQRQTHVLDIPGHATPDGQPLRCLARVLTALEESQAYERGRAYAIGKGIADPKKGDELYDLGVMAHTLVLACLDKDVPDAPFFDGGIDQVLTHLHPDMVLYLYERHELWQSEASPYTRQMNDTELLNTVSEVAAPDGVAAFIRLSPALRWSFTRSLVGLLSSLPEARSLFGLSSETAQPH